MGDSGEGRRKRQREEHTEITSAAVHFFFFFSLVMGAFNNGIKQTHAHYAWVLSVFPNLLASSDNDDKTTLLAQTQRRTSTSVRLQTNRQQKKTPKRRFLFCRRQIRQPQAQPQPRSTTSTASPTLFSSISSTTSPTSSPSAAALLSPAASTSSSPSSPPSSSASTASSPTTPLIPPPLETLTTTTTSPPCSSSASPSSPPSSVPSSPTYFSSPSSLGFLSSLPRRIPNYHSLSANDCNPSFTPSSVTHHSPVQVLKNFTDLRSLRIDLPSGELSLNDSFAATASSSTLLRWRAHFGSSLDRCLILAATSSSAKTLNLSPASTGSESTTADYGMIPDSFYTNGGLKLRVVWTISSLIAASARHYLLQPIIAEHTTLESLLLTDADGQGVLRMDREQLDELRTKLLSASSASKRTMVPALSLRLWYAPVLELSCGVVLKGATPVAIRPSSGEKKNMRLGWIEEAFDGDGDEGDGMYAEAVRMLVKRRTYCLEMNSF